MDDGDLGAAVGRGDASLGLCRGEGEDDEGEQHVGARHEVRYREPDMIANARMFTLTGAAGVVVRLSNYGGIITSILAPDREGRIADIVLGHDTLDGYRNNPNYLGAIIGRCANRIADARFTLDGTTFKLTANDGPNCLHGGRRGFDQVLWDAETFQRGGWGRRSVVAPKPDGDQGFPGALTVQVTYTLTDRNELVVDYHAETDLPTPVNLTQHSYWNLAGAGEAFWGICSSSTRTR